MIFQFIKAVGDAKSFGLSEDHARRQAIFLSGCPLFGLQEVNGLEAECLAFFAKLIQRNIAVSPTASRMVDVADGFSSEQAFAFLKTLSHRFEAKGGQKGKGF